MRVVLQRVGDGLDVLLRVGRDLPRHLEILVGVDRAVLRRQVADVSVGREHGVVGAEVLVDRLCLGGRLDHDDGHGLPFGRRIGGRDVGGGSGLSTPGGGTGPGRGIAGSGDRPTGGSGKFRQHGGFGGPAPAGTDGVAGERRSGNEGSWTDRRVGPRPPTGRMVAGGTRRPLREGPARPLMERRRPGRILPDGSSPSRGQAGSESSPPGRRAMRPSSSSSVISRVTSAGARSRSRISWSSATGEGPSRPRIAA